MKFSRYWLIIFFAGSFLVFNKMPCWANPLMELGEGSYGTPIIHSWEEGTKAIIGKYCSIAPNVNLFLGGDHRIDWVTTYPFPAFWDEAKSIDGFVKTKGNVIIGNDVWIGSNAVILSGVIVGDGAVIGNSAIVTKDVPPYAVVVGNPARVVKYRFSETVIQKLLKIKWWDWERYEIVEFLPYLLSADIDHFIHECEIRNKL